MNQDKDQDQNFILGFCGGGWCIIGGGGAIPSYEDWFFPYEMKSNIILSYSCGLQLLGIFNLSYKIEDCWDYTKDWKNERIKFHFTRKIFYWPGCCIGGGWIPVQSVFFGLKMISNLNDFFNFQKLHGFSKTKDVRLYKIGRSKELNFIL